jgi:hypothetical protein
MPSFGPETVVDAIARLTSDAARAAAEHDARVRDAALEEAADKVRFADDGVPLACLADAILALKGKKP